MRELDLLTIIATYPPKRKILVQFFPGLGVQHCNMVHAGCAEAMHNSFTNRLHFYHLPWYLRWFFAADQCPHCDPRRQDQWS